MGITARVLRDLRQERRAEARVILGAAVIDDVLSLIVLAVVRARSHRIAECWAHREDHCSCRPISMRLTACGIWLTPRIVRYLRKIGIHNLKLLFGVSFAFFLSWLANVAGLATIVGAFAAGMILNEFFDKELEGQTLHELLSPLEALIVPLFFVWRGIQVKVESLGRREVLLASFVLTVIAIVGKLVSGWGCPSRMNRWAVGFGMMPRGEVGLIFAGIGRSIGVVDDGLFSAVVLLVIVTTLLAPILLRAALGSHPA